MTTATASPAPNPDETLRANARQAGESKKEQLARLFPPPVVAELWLEDYDDLDAACRTGWLVDVPNDPDGLGVAIRKHGDSPVGERESDPRLRAKLHRLARPAAGLLYRIAAHLRQVEGAAFVPIEVTSLVRPWSYQRKLMATNVNADVVKAGVPPTHVFGLAFDIPRADMPYTRQRRLESYLRQLEAAGKVVYFKEGRSQSTFHVLAVPAANAEFELDFERLAAAGKDAVHGPMLPNCADVLEAEALEDTISW